MKPKASTSPPKPRSCSIFSSQVEPSSQRSLGFADLSGTFSHAYRTGEGDNLKGIGLLPSAGWEKVAEGRMRAPFVATNSETYTFIQEPSPALSGTFSHAYRTGEGEYCDDLEMQEKTTSGTIGTI